MKKIKINKIKEITLDLIDYFKNNIPEAKKCYSEITTNSRGLNKSELVGYYEKHHIVPKCVGGVDEESNYVLLTYREHLLAHMLLYIIYPNKKLEFAFNALINVFDLREKESIFIDLDVVSKIREEHSKNWKENNPTKTEEAIRKQAKSISGNNNPSKRVDVKKKISDKMKTSSNPMSNPQVRKKLNTKICGPDGTVYNSITEASEVLGISRTSILNKIKSGKGFSYVGLSKKPRIKVIDSKGTIYNSIRECARENNVGKTTLKKWIETNPEKGFKLIN